MKYCLTIVSCFFSFFYSRSQDGSLKISGDTVIKRFVGNRLVEESSYVGGKLYTRRDYILLSDSNIIVRYSIYEGLKDIREMFYVRDRKRVGEYYQWKNGLLSGYGIYSTDFNKKERDRKKYIFFYDDEVEGVSSYPKSGGLSQGFRYLRYDFFENGMPENQFTYDTSSRVLTEILYFPNGKKKSEIERVFRTNSLKIDIWYFQRRKEWDENGILISEKIY